MIIWLSERLRKEDKGFTLIELMVVVLIIAILIAIAIPTFLGARRRAQDRQAQSNLRNGLTAEKTYYADAQVYTSVDADLGEIESNLGWGTIEARARGVVVDAVADSGQTVVLKSYSASGSLFCIADVAQDIDASVNVANNSKAGTFYAHVEDVASTAAAAQDCTPADYETTTDGWS